VTSSIQRNIGPIALLLTGLGSIIGSGWLFGAWRAAGSDRRVGDRRRGHSGDCADLRRAWRDVSRIRRMVRYARYSHGALVGFISAWANWIAIVSVIPIEAEASIQYRARGPMNGLIRSS
jgi:amino acid transporter